MINRLLQIMIPALAFALATPAAWAQVTWTYTPVFERVGIGSTTNTGQTVNRGQAITFRLSMQVTQSGTRTGGGTDAGFSAFVGTINFSGGTAINAVTALNGFIVANQLPTSNNASEGNTFGPVTELSSTTYTSRTATIDSNTVTYQGPQNGISRGTGVNADKLYLSLVELLPFRTGATGAWCTLASGSCPIAVADITLTLSDAAVNAPGTFTISMGADDYGVVAYLGGATEVKDSTPASLAYTVAFPDSGILATAYDGSVCTANRIGGGLKSSEADDGTTPAASASNTFCVSLMTDPGGDATNVTINIESSDPAEGTVPTALTFNGTATGTTGSYADGQQVVLTGVDDDDVDGEQPYTVTLTSAFTALSTVTVSVGAANTDDENAAFAVRVANIVRSVGEGSGTVEIGVEAVFDWPVGSVGVEAPATAIAVSYAAENDTDVDSTLMAMAGTGTTLDGSVDYMGATGMLTFAMNGFEMVRNISPGGPPGSTIAEGAVTVSIVNDTLEEEDEMFRVRLFAVTGADAVLDTTTVTVMVNDQPIIGQRHITTVTIRDNEGVVGVELNGDSCTDANDALILYLTLHEAFGPLVRDDPDERAALFGLALPSNNLNPTPRDFSDWLGAAMSADADLNNGDGTDANDALIIYLTLHEAFGPLVSDNLNERAALFGLASPSTNLAPSPDDFSMWRQAALDLRVQGENACP